MEGLRPEVKKLGKVEVRKDTAMMEDSTDKIGRRKYILSIPPEGHPPTAPVFSKFTIRIHNSQSSRPHFHHVVDRIIKRIETAMRTEPQPPNIASVGASPKAR